MAVTYEEARDIVVREVGPTWQLGTFCLDDRQIVENDEVYVFSVGAREYLVDGDINYAVPGGVPVVYKADGRLEWRPSFMTATDDSLRTRENPNPTLRV
jgi:hypothetical protein